MFDPLHIPQVFRAGTVRTPAHELIASGCDELDAALAGGWPSCALIEVLVDTYGVGELWVLLALLRHRVAVATTPALMVWLNPPYIPNGVAFQQANIHASHWCARDLAPRDVAWAAEQSVRSRACVAVLAWCTSPSTAALRRLKLGVTSADTPAIVFRCVADAVQPSPANLRLVLRPERERLRIDVIKNEGRKPAGVCIDVDARLQHMASA